ncbi:SurA N-terminal domain-containing protein [Saccharospirillum salsuginis]|uniref:Periplasmic chaperone PpiD n=1 Tax=Saccharospirillum salsuginis TaxID=418750 RepID=A0A918K6X6_9GAMM|nr:SurA N-terminal domain-containing protein [Saccharospirillum salsuginis]GGX51676.1 peptidylprolyl isomerase [Saccharospirillum salsuginis]
MLEIVRKLARGTAGKVIVGVIVVAFTLGGAFSVVNIVNNSDPVQVNGEGISDVEIQRLVSMRQQQLMQQLGENATPELLNSAFIRQSVINSLINQELQLQASSNLGMAVSPEQVSREITSIPAFQVDGQFDEETYRRVLAQNGYTPNTFRAERASQLRLNQMQTGLVASAFTLDREVDRVAELDNQQREVSYKLFRAEDFVEEVDITDADIQSYYDANSSEFLSDERVQVRFVRLSASDLVPDMVVTEADLEAEYDSYVAEQESDANREVSHILFAEGDDTLAEARSALERLESGESFADLAAELSDDPASADAGGSLGELVEGFYVEEFYQAAMSLTEVGEVSEPVETEFGYHLIRLDSLSSAQITPLADMRDELEQRIKREKAEEEFALVESQLADAAFTSESIEAVSETFGTTVNITDWITRNGNEGVTSDPAFLSTAFSPAVIDEGRISDVVRLDNGDLVVMQLEDYQPEQVQALAEVRDEIEQVLTAEQSRELATAAAEAEIEQVRAEGALPGEGWVEPVVIGRNNSELPADLVNFSFSMPKPNGAALTVDQSRVSEGVYTVAVLDVSSGEPEAEEVDNLSDFLAERHGQTEYQSFFNALRAGADIEIQGQGQAPSQNSPM